MSRQGVSHGVVDAQADIGEAHASDILTKSHALAAGAGLAGLGLGMPVEAVRPAGMEAIMSGSTTATSGASLVSTHTNLRTFSGSVMT